MQLRKKMLAIGIAASVGIMPLMAQQTPKKGEKATEKPSAFKLVEEVKKKGNELVIPYAKYVLPNGLTLVIHEDHSDPIVYVDVTYHVGSAREQQGRSGFAHFFEHMMFQGSKNVADEQHFKIITEAGGDLNGTTNRDRTNYFETVPSNQLEKMLWLESDRMGFLLDSVTQKKFEVQRATVKNERGQRYDNRPYGLISEKVGEALYPKGHPYSWTTIGYIEDLNRVDVNDLKRFYMRWYGPNNATLTIAGDVKREEVLKLAEKYFGTIPRGPEVKNMVVATNVLPETRFISYEDNVKFPMLQMAWPSVPAYHPDEAALDALASILFDGKSSLFYEMLIKNQKAIAANGYNYSSEHAGQFELSVKGNKDASLSQLKAEVDAVFKAWEAKGVTEEDVKKFVAFTEKSLYENLATVRGKGAQLASYQTFTGNPNQLKKDVERYSRITKEDVLRVYNTYIKGKNLVVLSCVPKGKGDLKASNDSWKMYERTVESESAEYKNLSYIEPKDNFSRSQMPNAGPAVSVKVPTTWTYSFKNGLKAMGVFDNELPIIHFQLNMKAGHVFEKIEKSGTAALMAELLNESTKLHSAKEIGDMVDKLGSSIYFAAQGNEIIMYVSSLKKNLKATLAIAEEMLMQPKFSAEDFELIKKQTLDRIAQQNMAATSMAESAYRRILYGKDHIFAWPSIGTEETINNIKLEDVQAYYAQQLSPSVSSLVVIGDVEKEELKPMIGFLENWEDKKIVAPKLPAVPVIEKTRVYFVDKKSAPQSELRIGAPAMLWDATGDYYKSVIMNFPFGGSFNGRVNLTLREKRGYTYGARGRFGADMYSGNYTMSTGVRADATDSALVDYFSELRQLVAGGLTQEELSFTKNSMGQSEALEYEEPGKKAGFIKNLLDYNLSPEIVKEQTKVLESLSLPDTKVLIQKYLQPDKMVIVVVGDKEKYLEKVKKLGWEVVEIDVNGQIIGQPQGN